MMIQHILVTSGCAGMMVLGQIPLHTLLAQTPAPMPGVGEEFIWRISSSLGALAILAWYFYQTQTKTIPEKDSQLAAERMASDVKIKATLDASDERTKATLEATALERKYEREAHQASIERIVNDLREEREARMKIIEQCGMNKANRP